MHYVQNLRGIAIILIVSTHAISVLYEPGPFAIFLNILIGNGSVLFIAISGYLFSRTSNKARYLDVFKSKLEYVVLPYMITSFPAAMLYSLGIKNTHDWLDVAWMAQQPFIARLAYLYLTGAHLGPLWFIPMIVLIFLCAPAVSRLKSIPFNLLWIVSTAAALYFGRPAHDSNALQSGIFFLPIFILGISINRNLQSNRSLPSAIYYIGSGIVFLYAVSCMFIPVLSDERIQLAVFGACVPLAFSAASRFLKRKLMVLDVLGRLSFPIYFFHGYIAAALRAMFARYVSYELSPPIEFLAIATASSFMICCCVAIFVVSKLVVGRQSRRIVGA